MKKDEVDREEEAEALQSIFDTDFNFLDKKTSSLKYQITITDSTLVSEKLTATFTVICHPKKTPIKVSIEGDDLPRTMILGLEKQIKLMVQKQFIKF